MGRVSQLGETRNIVKKLKEGDLLGDLDRTIILKITLKKFGVKMWIGFF
jgi:hypothetical protein